MGAEKASLSSKVLKASYLILIAHLAFKCLGLIQISIVGRVFDQKISAVVYATVFSKIILIFFYLGEEVIGPAFLPVFSRLFSQEKMKKAWAFASNFLCLQSLLLMGISLSLFTFPEFFIEAMPKIDPEQKPERYQLAVESLRLLAPSLFFMSLASTTYMILNGHKRFFLAAFGDASLKLFVVLFLIIGVIGLGFGYRALIFGLLFGSIAKLLTHLIGLLSELKHFRPRINLKDPNLKQFLILALPLIFGIVLAKFRDLYNGTRVMSHIENNDTLIIAIEWGTKLYATLGQILPYALSIAMFPYFCELIDRNNRKMLAEFLTQSSRILLCFFVPLSILLFFCSFAITAVVYRGGKFEGEVVDLTALSMSCYILVLPGYALEHFLMQAFFADRRMISVTLIGMVCSILSVLISYFGVVHFGLEGEDVIKTIALGFTFSRTLKAFILILYLKRHLEIFPFMESIKFFVKLLVLSICIGSVAFGVQKIWGIYVGIDQLSTALALLGVQGGVALTVFCVLVKGLNLQEPFLMLDWAQQKLKKRFVRS